MNFKRRGQNEAFSLFCSECGNGYHTKTGLDIHEEKKHNIFKNKIKRNKSQHRKDGVKKYICETCGFGYETPTGLIVHEQRYHGRIRKSRKQKTEGGYKPSMRLFKCQKCAEVFRSWPAYVKHRRSKHNSLTEPHARPSKNKQSFYYSCKLCDRVLKDESFLMRHMYKFHDGIQVVSPTRDVDPEHIFKCNGCAAAYTTPEAIQKHKEFHKEYKKNKKYHSNLSKECKLCQKSYKNDREWSFHVLSTHTRKLYSECKICQSKFTLQCTIKKHLLGVHQGLKESRHHGFRKSFDKLPESDKNEFLKCKNCEDFKAESFSELIQHLQTHTIAPYSCNHCEYYESDKMASIRHVSLKHLGCSTLDENESKIVSPRKRKQRRKDIDRQRIKDNYKALKEEKFKIVKQLDIDCSFNEPFIEKPKKTVKYEFSTSEDCVDLKYEPENEEPEIKYIAEEADVKENSLNLNEIKSTMVNHSDILRKSEHISPCKSVKLDSPKSESINENQMSNLNEIKRSLVNDEKSKPEPDSPCKSFNLSVIKSENSGEEFAPNSMDEERNDAKPEQTKIRTESSTIPCSGKQLTFDEYRYIKPFYDEDIEDSIEESILVSQERIQKLGLKKKSLKTMEETLSKLDKNFSLIISTEMQSCDNSKVPQTFLVPNYLKGSENSKPQNHKSSIEYSSIRDKMMIKSRHHRLRTKMLKESGYFFNGRFITYGSKESYYLKDKQVKGLDEQKQKGKEKEQE